MTAIAEPTEAAPESTASKGNDWANRYPPLLVLAIAAFIALAILPSALNLPQSNPTRTLEYAPVPPSDKDTPPSQTGNLASLGLAGGSSIGTGGAPGGAGPGGPPPPSATPSGAGRSPSTKRCVGNPPRQTQDPLAPPCVANFDGNNFGATYQGVAKDEIRVLFYLDAPFTDCVTAQGCETRPQNIYVDLASEPSSDDHFYVRALRGWQRYFNDRYQTYGRFVHFWVYFGSSNTSTVSPEQRRGDAAENFATIKPFAVVAYTNLGGNGDAYLEAMAQRGVLNFGSFLGRSAAFYQKFPKLIWGYLPSTEVQAKLFSNYVCREIVAPGKVTFSANNDLGQPRVLGMLKSADDSHPELAQFAAIVQKQVEACGGTFATTQTFPRTGYIANTEYSPAYATAGAAAFQQAKVTTIIWPQGFETNYSKQAANIGYRPEWVIAGDGLQEGNDGASYQEQSEWDHARVVSTVAYNGPIRDGVCYKEYRSSDPDAPEADVTFNCFLTMYQDIGRLFTGIQVAGPRLTPTTVDKGMHAIPAVPSSSNMVPACFYEPGDYTCVKDGVAEWYDSTCRVTPTASPGCWRMPEQGARYFAEVWPDRDAKAADKPDDLPNLYSGGIFIQAGTPKG